MAQPPRRSPQHPLAALAVSLAAHAAVLALAVTRARPAELPTARDRSAERAERPRAFDLVYLPPAPAERPRPGPPELPPPPPAPVPAPPTPPTQRVAPPPPAAQPEPEDEPNAPPEAERASGREEPEEGAEQAGTAEGSAATGPEEGNAGPTLESEARRLFGPPPAAPPGGAGPRASRPLEAWLPEDPARCVPRPAAPREAGAPPEIGTVVGRIFRREDGRPLAGAHLQMVGTPYVAFTDDRGEYRFRFDMALVENCRTQYVRVTARGYESQLLVLVVGAKERSDDVLLRRR